MGAEELANFLSRVSKSIKEPAEEYPFDIDIKMQMLLYWCHPKIPLWMMATEVAAAVFNSVFQYNEARRIAASKSSSPLDPEKLDVATTSLLRQDEQLARRLSEITLTGEAFRKKAGSLGLKPWSARSWSPLKNVEFKSKFLDSGPKFKGLAHRVISILPPVSFQGSKSRFLSYSVIPWGWLLGACRLIGQISDRGFAYFFGDPHRRLIASMTNNDKKQPVDLLQSINQKTPLQGRPSLFYPPWIRLPRSGEKCQYTGLSRSSLNSLVLGENPPVASVVLTQPGSNRGVRLIFLESLLDFLNQKLAEQSGKSGAQ